MFLNLSKRSSNFIYLNLRSAHNTSQMRGRMLDTQLIDTYIPPEKFPFGFSSKSRAALWLRLKKAFQSTLGVAMLKWNLKGWKPKPFALEAQKMYIGMNQAIFSNQKNKLRDYCTDGMIAKISTETKKFKMLGQVKWSNFGQESRPILVHLARAQAQLPEGTQNLFQATVKVQVKQSLAIYQGNKLIGGNPEKVVAPVEYIVLEKWIDQPEDTWKIKGKVTPPEST